MRNDLEKFILSIKKKEIHYKKLPQLNLPPLPKVGKNPPKSLNEGKVIKNDQNFSYDLVKSKRLDIFDDKTALNLLPKSPPPLPVSHKSKKILNHTLKAKSKTPIVHQKTIGKKTTKPQSLYLRVQTIMQQKKSNITPKEGQATYFKQDRFYSSHKSPFLSMLLMFISCGFYWGYWVKRVLFEMTMSLNINIKLNIFYDSYNILKYPHYSQAIIALIRKAENKLAIKFSGSDYLSTAKYFPPLFVYISQSIINQYFTEIEKIYKIHHS